MTQPEIEIRRAWRHAAGPEHTGYVDALLLRYREPHRYYHTATHVMLVLRSVHDLSATAGHEPTPELIAAALYHDAIYDPRATDSEAHSAELAERDLAEIGWPSARRATVAALVRATATHLSRDDGDEPADEATAILLDADLAILGADPPTYQAYATGVRAEYCFLDDEQWRTGRGSVLQHFLDSPRLYRTDQMHHEREHRARANLRAELAELAALAPRAD